jgi:hypothetical protein
MIWCNSVASNLLVSSGDEVHCVVVVFLGRVTVTNWDIHEYGTGGDAFVSDEYGCAGRK